MRWPKLNSKSFFLLLALFIILSMAFVTNVLRSTPPVFLLLNDKAMQCASMSDGDEFESYAVPQSWEIAKPDASGFIQTQYGSCSYSEVVSAENCCQELGYTYIGWIKGEKRLSLRTLVFVLYMISMPFGIVFFIYFPVFLFKKLVEYMSKKQKNTGE